MPLSLSRRSMALSVSALALAPVITLMGCAMPHAQDAASAKPARWLDQFERGLSPQAPAQGVASARTTSPAGAELTLMWSQDTPAFVTQLQRLGQGGEVIHDARDNARGVRETRLRLPNGQFRAFSSWRDSTQTMRLAHVQAASDEAARALLAQVDALRDAGRFGGPAWLATPSVGSPPPAR